MTDIRTVVMVILMFVVVARKVRWGRLTFDSAGVRRLESDGVIRVMMRIVRVMRIVGNLSLKSY